MTADAVPSRDRLMPAIILTQAFLFGFAIFCQAFIPRLLPGIVILAGLLSIVALVATGTLRGAIASRWPLILLCGALAGYIALGALWGFNPSAALGKAVLAACLFSAGLALSAYVETLPPPVVRTLSRALLTSLIVSCLLLLLIYLFGQPARAFLHNWFPSVTDVSGKHVTKEDGVVVLVENYRLNRSFANMAIMLFPGLLIAWAMTKASWRRASVLALALMIGAGVLLSESESAKFALLAGALVAGLGYLSGRWAIGLCWALTIAWTVAVVFAVPLGALPHKLGWHEWTWLPKRNVAARAYIWRYTADKVAERPLTGIGVRGTRKLQKAVPEARSRDLASRLRLRPGRHAHNGYLQLWLELGAIGAAFVLALGLYGLRIIARGPPHLRPMGLALFAALATLAAAGWGIWQSWLLATCVFVWPVLQLAGAAAEEEA